VLPKFEVAQVRTADEKLSSLAEGGINQKAADTARPDDEESEKEEPAKPRPVAEARRPAAAPLATSGN